MRGFSFFCLLIISFFDPKAQTAPSSLGQIFNLAQGDSFEYQYSWRTAPVFQYSDGGYGLLIIDSTKSANDTLVLGYTYVHQSIGCFVNCNYFSDIPLPNFGFNGYHVQLLPGNVFKIYMVDSSFNTMYYPACAGLDSPQCYFQIVDSSIYNGRKTDRHYELELSSVDETYGEGIGLINRNNFIENDLSILTQFNLIYYHKANGEIWGQAQPITSGIIDNQADMPGVEIIPNPVADNFQLRFAVAPPPKTNFLLMDAIGRKLVSKEITSDKSPLQRQNLCAGLYFWVVEVNGTVNARGCVVFK